MAISKDFLLALQATAELCGQPFSDGGLALLAEDLDGLNEAAMLKALRRCRAEIKGRLCASDILNRIEDGHPGPEEAWSMLPRNEDDTCVMTGEMAAAWGVAWPLLKAGEEVAARMAFKEVYIRNLAEARYARSKPKWFPSIGHDKNGREGPLMDAVSKGRLAHRHIEALLPPPDGNRLTALLAPVLDRKRIPPPAMNDGKE